MLTRSQVTKKTYGELAQLIEQLLVSGVSNDRSEVWILYSPLRNLRWKSESLLNQMDLLAEPNDFKWRLPEMLFDLEIIVRDSLWVYRFDLVANKL